MRLDVYFNHPGHRQEASRFYEQHLGGKITVLHAPAGPPEGKH